MKLRKTCAGLLLLMCSTLAIAHQQSTSFLRLTLPADVRQPVQLRLDLALLDLEHAVGLDDDADGQISWGELRGHEAAIRQYVESRLQVEAPAASASSATDCTRRFGQLRVDAHADGAYAVLDYSIACPHGAGTLTYGLLFDLDNAHRALVSVQRPDGTLQTAVLTSATQVLQLAGAAAARSGWRDALQWVQQGIWHIWLGYDHLLFLLTLLLPAVVQRVPGRGWLAQPSLRTALLDVARVVTAFTAAHSLTLVLASLRWLRFDTRWVESMIAFTVLLGALNILFPVVRERRWMLALAFGLVHGLGFAAALGDLGLAGRHLVRNLLLFNLGVEAGQLAIVAVFVPATFLLRGQWWYRSVATPAAASAVGVLALWWLTQRVMG